MTFPLPLIEVDEHSVASLYICDEDQLVSVDSVEATLAHAIEDYYASRGYYVAIELA
tara:strand:+ start:1244 stop:1414 length:171 start_codon:yes stop_codon:yes gene_type:complete